MSALSESLNAFGILVDLRNCPVACNDAGILPYYHIKYWTQQSANNCCNLFLQIFMGGFDPKGMLLIKNVCGSLVTLRIA